MTKKIYETNQYIKECTANIINKENIDNKLYLELDQSIFFPNAGGQPSDKGTINESKILNVIIKDNKLLHQVDKIPKSNTVLCKLDWHTRLDNMQQHCGEHILSGVLLKHYNINNIGFRVGKDDVTIDIDSQNLSKEDILIIENLCNDIIYKNIPIDIKIYKDINKISDIDIRKDIIAKNYIRIVNIPNIDIVACCGSHPGTTGEVGILKIIKVDNFKTNARIHFLCGKRALNHYQKNHNIITKLFKLFSSNINTLLSTSEQFIDKNSNLQLKYKTLHNMYIDKFSDDLIRTSSNNFIIESLDYNQFINIQNIASNILQKDKYTVLLSIKESNFIVFANNKSETIDCGNTFRDKLKNYNGKGGGNKNIAFANFQNYNDLKNFFNYIKSSMF